MSNKKEIKIKKSDDEFYHCKRVVANKSMRYSKRDVKVYIYPTADLKFIQIN